MRVQTTGIPVVLMAVPVLVRCTACKAQTTEPKKIMSYRSELITDGCAECSTMDERDGGDDNEATGSHLRTLGRSGAAGGALFATVAASWQTEGVGLPLSGKGPRIESDANKMRR